MKIKSSQFLIYQKSNFEKFNIIFLHGPNLGQVELLYKKSIKSLGINEADPFNVSKIDGNEFKENPTVFHDNISTLCMFSDRRYILLDLTNINLTKTIEKIIQKTIEEVKNNYFLIIKSGNLKVDVFVKFFQNLKNCISIACYFEEQAIIRDVISNLLKKYKVSISEDFLTKLTSKFNQDSLINKMEFKKLETFLVNNTNVSEQMLLNVVSNNENVNLDKIIEFCSSGDANKSLYYFGKVYENSGTSIALIRMFGNHFKLIEQILISAQNKADFESVVNNMKPPIFFKKKAFIISQCKLWTLSRIHLILKRLIELEIKCKFHNNIEKTLVSQFILSTSVLVKKRIKT